MQRCHSARPSNFSSGQIQYCRQKYPHLKKRFSPPFLEKYKRVICRTTNVSTSDRLARNRSVMNLSVGVDIQYPAPLNTSTM